MDEIERAVDREANIIKVVYTSPNQKIICCHNDSLTRIKKDNEAQGDKHIAYDCVIHDIDSAVMNNLSGNEYKMHCYFRKNQDGYSFALSPVDACRYTGLSEKAYLSAVKSLIAKGYLVQRSKPKNMYDFYIQPQQGQDTAIQAVSSPLKGGINIQHRAVSSPAKDGFHTAPKGEEIIQDNTINNTGNNILNSTVDNTTLNFDFQYDDDELPF